MTQECFIINPPAVRRPRSRRGAFTFIEVLFAVILLGIGFILIAAIFPVAIQQAQANSNDAQGTLVARDAVRYVQAVASSSYFVSAANPNQTYFPATGLTVVPFSVALVNGVSANNLVGGNAYMTGDGRYGWTGFYRRVNVTDPFMQIWIVAMQNPNFTGSANNAASPPNVPPYIPSTVTNGTTCSLAYTAGAPATITFTTPPANLIEGAFVLIANDNATHALNGRVLRIGSQVSATVYDLQPGFDVSASDNTNFSASFANDNVYVIGRAPDPTQAAGDTTVTGADQDIALQTTFVRVNN